MTSMKIGKNTVVTVNYKLSDAQGNLIEESREPMVYLHGGFGNTLPKIEEALEGQAVGYSVDLKVEPEDAFGEYDADLVKIEPRSRLPTPLEIGMQFEGMPDSEDDADGVDDADEALVFTVTEIADDKVVLDGNHPLAGLALVFFLEVSDVRAATEEEVAHMHVHGAHGHHDDHDLPDDEEGDQFRTHPIH
jgi:FKBP-type peptidyl-prolyl cis-trans isomerase SlyD